MNVIQIIHQSVLQNRKKSLTWIPYNITHKESQGEHLMLIIP